MKSLAPWQLLVLLGIGTQLLKLVLYGAANRRLNLRMLVTTNGLPSLHGVVFMALAVTVGLEHGFASAIFTATWIFGGIVLHDLVKGGWLRSLGKGRYLIIPLAAGPERQYTTHEFLIAWLQSAFHGDIQNMGQGIVAEGYRLI